MRAFCFEVTTNADQPKFVRDVMSYMLRLRYHYIEDAKDFVKVASAIKTVVRHSNLCQSYGVEVQVQRIGNIGEIILRRADSGKVYANARFYLEVLKVEAVPVGQGRFGRNLYMLEWDDTQKKGGDLWPTEE